MRARQVRSACRADGEGEAPSGASSDDVVRGGDDGRHEPRALEQLRGVGFGSLEVVHQAVHTRMSLGLVISTVVVCAWEPAPPKARVSMCSQVPRRPGGAVPLSRASSATV